RLAEDRRRPGAVERLGRAGIVIGDRFQVLALTGVVLAPPARPFGAQGHVAHDPKQERAEFAAPPLHAVEGAALLETLQEDLLDGVVEFVPARRGTPARRQVRPDDGIVAARELRALAGAPRSRGLNDGPAGRFGSGHESGPIRVAES